MKIIRVLKFISLFCITVIIISSSSVIHAVFEHPYGMCSWMYPDTACDMFKAANINYYRDFVSWAITESSDVTSGNINDPKYNWWLVYVAVNGCKRTGAKVLLAVYDSPVWARSDPNKRLSFNTDKYEEFLIDMLKYADNYSSGCVWGVDLGNEDPIWEPKTERDPSWYYAKICKAGYHAVKSYNPDLVVVPNCCWAPAMHFLDEMYQMGCKGYIDRINLHYYVQGMGAIENPAYPGSIMHYMTNIRYLKYIAECNGDSSIPLLNTEYGWKWNDEKTKSDYYKYILDVSRESGFTERTFMYPGASEHWPGTDCDYSALIYYDTQWISTPTIVATTSYYMYKSYSQQYPTWPGTQGPMFQVLPAASKDVDMINNGFELGNTSGWSNITLDSSVKHSGQYSGKITVPNTASTINYKVEHPGKLYEVVGWIKVSAPGPEDCNVKPAVLETLNGGTPNVWFVPHYGDHIWDTRNYPNGWRRIRFMYLSSTKTVQTDTFEIALQFYTQGTGEVWIDDFSINKLDFKVRTIVVDPKTLDFGEIAPKDIKTLSFNITTNTQDAKILTGNIYSSQEWITVSPTSFSGKDIIVYVTVDGNILKQNEGEYTGEITINSDGGDETVNVRVTATCVLAKPNPYNPEKGNLTFYGNGIVPGQTIIKIYTLSGELVKEITSPVAHTGDNEITWDGKNGEGVNVTDGIYLYTYDSPKEKGINKFTVISK